MTPTQLMLPLGLLLLLAVAMVLINVFGIDPLGFSSEEKYTGR